MLECKYSILSLIVLPVADGGVTKALAVGNAMVKDVIALVTDTGTTECIVDGISVCKNLNRLLSDNNESLEIEKIRHDNGKRLGLMSIVENAIIASCRTR